MKIFTPLKRFPLFLIPLFTALIACADSWTTSNLSVVAYGVGSRNALVLLGLILAFYIPYYMFYLFHLVKYESKGSTVLLFCVSALSILAVTTPYLPQSFPFRSWLHIVFAFTFPLMFLGVYAKFLYFLTKINEPHFRIIWYVISATAVIAIGLLVYLGRVTSLLEILITFATCLLLFLLERKILSLPKK